ncbi:MAG: P1 family peptidase [Gemmatimonadota bacterium]|jgi:L-aminopeptidase/D-esterase-like protein
MPAITDVPGIRVGHAQDDEARTGCTVLLGPFRGASDIRGLGTGTRELDTLSMLHLVPQANALLLTGGSAFGLGAADGVMAWLRERGEGFDVGVVRVPIVPAAVIFDLGVGRSDRWPDAAMARAACEAAGTVVPEGVVGAGTGATVGKITGPEGAVPGGVGTWSASAVGATVGALAVVNALGDVRDGDGRIIAGARGADGRFVDAAALLRSGEVDFGGPAEPSPGTNTTLAVVATDAPLTRSELHGLARAASAALARRITPAGTPFDGDITFALATAGESGVGPRGVLALSAVATQVLETAIERAVATSA